MLRHPEVEITTVTSRSEGNPHIASVHPQLAGRIDLRLEDLTPEAVAGRAQCIFSCLPHGVTAAAVPPMLAAGARIVDFAPTTAWARPKSLPSGQTVEEHPDPERLGKTVYGLPELFRERIRDAQLVANPGCYPTSAILP